MNLIYLSLGSNLGNSKTYLQQACHLIVEQLGCIENTSSIYKTAAWGNTNQPDFLNQVICIKSQLEPKHLLRHIQTIEAALGRKRVEKWGARTIDIDILFYASQIIQEADLIIPHPYLHQRRFVLEPLNEIAPAFEHPLKKKTIKELLTALEDNLQVTLCKKEV